MNKLRLPLFRGYVNDSYDDLVVRNEYLVFSVKRVRSHFINFTDPDLSQFDSQFLFDLDCFNFWMSITDRVTYWENYLKKGHPISLSYGYPEWVGRSILAENESEVELSFEMLRKNIESIHASKRDTFIRLQSLVPCYEVLIPSSNNLKYLYARCGYPLGKSILEIGFLVVGIEQSSCKSRCKLHCSVSFVDEYNERGKLFFDVFAFTPNYFAGEIENESWIFPPHIIIDILDVARVEEYLLSTLSLIQVSSKLELILKLGVFTNSFLGSGDSAKRLYSDIGYELKTVLFDQRGLV